MGDNHAETMTVAVVSQTFNKKATPLRFVSQKPLRMYLKATGHQRV